MSPPQISWLEEKLLQLFTRCLRSKIYCFTLSLLHTNCLAGKKHPKKAITLSGSAVFAALQGFPWRAATVLRSEKSSEIDLEREWLGYPPRPSQTRGIGSHLHPTSISIPNPILCPGAAAAPGSPGRRRDGNTKAGSVCILSSATPAAAGR